jgi:hypothetical protein
MVEPAFKAEKTDVLWKIVTGRKRPKERYNDKFDSLKSDILKNEFTGHDPDLFIPKEVGRISYDMTRFDWTIKVEDVTKARGSEFIKKIKEVNKERDDNLNYSHLLAERLNNFGKNIVLLGPYGSGKSHKLAFVLSKYIDNHNFCDNENCFKKKRYRLVMEIDPKNYHSARAFYKGVYINITEEIKRYLSNYYEKIYKIYLNDLFTRIEQGEKIDFFNTLTFNGLDKTYHISFKDFARMKLSNNERIDLLNYVIDFLGWLRARYYKHPVCILLIFDNIDSSNMSVQKAIMSLITRDTDLNILCAMRDETFLNFSSNRSLVIDVIPHIGPSAYEIVIERLSHYIESFKTGAIRPGDLESKLLGFNPFEFIDNLELLVSKLKNKHFEEFFDDLFGYYIRGALVFAQGIVDIAASRDNTFFKKYNSEHSLFALERLLLQPWGLRCPVNYLDNVFYLCEKVEHKLLPLRILLYLYQNKRNKITVKLICTYLDIFGCSKDDAIYILNRLLSVRFIVAVTKENLRLDEYSNSYKEIVRLTQVGEGVSIRAFTLSYLQVEMYYSLCSADYYTRLNNLDPNLYDTLEVLRMFLHELTDLELKEMECVKSERMLTFYKSVYSDSSICFMLYERVLESVLKILNTNPNIKSIAHNYISDYVVLSNRLRNSFGLRIDEKFGYIEEFDMV